MQNVVCLSWDYIGKKNQFVLYILSIHNYVRSFLKYKLTIVCVKKQLLAIKCHMLMKPRRSPYSHWYSKTYT